MHEHFRADIIMGGGALPPVPDWKSYQVGSHTPELEKVQKMLKSMGLKVGQEDSLIYLDYRDSMITVACSSGPLAA